MLAFCIIIALLRSVHGGRLLQEKWAFCSYQTTASARLPPFSLVISDGPQPCSRAAGFSHVFLRGGQLILWRACDEGGFKTSDLLAKITFEGEMGQMEGCDEC